MEKEKRASCTYSFVVLSKVISNTFSYWALFWKKTFYIFECTSDIRKTLHLLVAFSQCQDISKLHDHDFSFRHFFWVGADLCTSTDKLMNWDDPDYLHFDWEFQHWWMDKRKVFWMSFVRYNVLWYLNCMKVNGIFSMWLSFCLTVMYVQFWFYNCQCLAFKNIVFNITSFSYYYHQWLGLKNTFSLTSFWYCNQCLWEKK